MTAPQSRETELFRFVSRALPDEALHVVRFRGAEGINELFSFTIDLVSPNMSLDTEKLLSDRATFTITREDGTQAVFNGYPASVEQGGAFHGYSYYTVELRPALWKMTRIVQSRIFLDQTLGETLAELLRSESFFSFPFALDFTRADYPRREFAMQYEESVYDYLLWRLEEQGAYYYFEQSEERDTIHFADGPTSHLAQAHGDVLRYAPVSGLERTPSGEGVISFTLSQTQLPRQVVIRSYSWTNPNKPIVGIAPVSDNGLGDVYLTGENVESDAEAERLARLRAEALRCQARRFSGTSAVPDLRPGYTFRLEGHHNAALNQEYLITQLTHEGSQESFINLGLGLPLEGVADHLFYRNDFACIEARMPFRPQKTAPRAKISGVIHAFIDGASDGSRPEIDEFGRYKLLFPFDISSRRDGKASCWIRRAQEQVGRDSGMSFPLLNGTEVLVSFVDGNPDRPYITGALSNVETGALTRNGNRNVSGISTPGGNALIFGDVSKKQGISLTSASGNGFTMGSGGLDLGVSSYTTWGSVSADGGTELAGIAKNVVSGNSILNEVMAPGGYKYLFPVFEAMQEALAAGANGFSQTADAGDDVGANSLYMTAAKTAVALVSTVWETVVFAKDRATNYGFTVRSEEGSTMSKLTAPTNVAETVLLFLAMLASASGKTYAGAEDAAKEEEEDKKEADEEEEKEKKEADGEEDEEKKKQAYAKAEDKKQKAYAKAENKKQRAVSSALASSLSDLLPEIIAKATSLYISKGLLSKANMGGVLLHAQDANIGLHSGTTIGLAAKQGMLLYSGDCIDGKLGAHYGGNVWKWGSNSVAMPTDDSYNQMVFNFYNASAMGYVHPGAQIAVNTVSNFAQPGFLADVSEMRYSKTKNSVALADQQHVSLAKKHNLASCSDTAPSAPGNSLIIQEADSDAAPQDELRAPSKKSGIFLTSREGTVSAQATDDKRAMILGDKGILLAANSGSLEGKPQIFLSDDAVYVKLKDSFLEIKQGDVSLYAKDGGDSAFVHLKGGQIGIYSSNNQIELGQLKVEGGNVTGVSAINQGDIKFISGPNAVMPTSNPMVSTPTLDGEGGRTLA
jgi:type VI secretion system VgrG family protein